MPSLSENMAALAQVQKSPLLGFQSAEERRLAPMQRQNSQLEMLQKQAALDSEPLRQAYIQEQIAASQSGRNLKQQEAEAGQQLAFGRLADVALSLPEGEQRNSFIRDTKALHGIEPEDVTEDFLKNVASAAKTIDEAESKEKIQQVPGMPGYYFDPNDPNQPFKVDAKMGASIAKTQQELKNKDKWDIDATEKVNSKVTALVKPAVDIHSSAVALEGLRKSGSAAAKLAAIFKFMKALDPTSVVRETEQGQVYEAQGVAAQFAGMVNNIIGEGKLMESGFDDLVNTAKVLSNSAIDSATQSVTGFIDVFDDMPQSTYKNLLKRIPSGFDIKETETTQAIPPQILKSMTSEQREIYNRYTPEEQERFRAALTNDNSGKSGQAKRFK